jgi:hypothetical protein
MPVFGTRIKAPIPWNKSPNRCFLGTTQIGGNALFLAKTFGNQALCPTTSAKTVEERSNPEFTLESTDYGDSSAAKLQAKSPVFATAPKTASTGTRESEEEKI